MVLLGDIDLNAGTVFGTGILQHHDYTFCLDGDTRMEKRVWRQAAELPRALGSAADH